MFTVSRRIAPQCSAGGLRELGGCTDLYYLYHELVVIRPILRGISRLSISRRVIILSVVPLPCEGSNRSRRDHPSSRPQELVLDSQADRDSLREVT